MVEKPSSHYIKSGIGRCRNQESSKTNCIAYVIKQLKCKNKNGIQKLKKIFLPNMIQNQIA